MIPVGGDWPWYLFYAANFLVATHGWRHPILDAAWSLAIEEQFYMVWPVVVLLLATKRLRDLSVGLIAFSALSRIVLLAMGVSWTSVYVLTPCRFDAIALGAYIAATWREPFCWWKDSARVRWIVRWIAYAGTPVALVLYATANPPYGEPETLRFGYTATTLLFGSWLCASLALPDGSGVNRLLSNSVLRFFGKYSYAMYLFHSPIGAEIRDTLFRSRRLNAVLPNEIVKQFVFYAVALAVVVPAALLSWNVLEKPMLALKERFRSSPRFGC
jgi:peptidoglycan/LPS O-acetylase OafA/YrhL